MTDRELLLAILNAVCGLAERVTGERMVVSVESEGGHKWNVYGDPVSWKSRTDYPAP